MLRRIVFSPFDFIALAAADPTLDGVWENDNPAPFLVLYQHGKSVWAGPPEDQVHSATFWPDVKTLKQLLQKNMLRQTAYCSGVDVDPINNWSKAEVKHML